MALKRVSVAIFLGSYVLALADASLLWPHKSGLAKHIESSPKLSLLQKPLCLLKNVLDGLGCLALLPCNCVQCQSHHMYNSYGGHSPYDSDHPDNIHALLALIQTLHASLAHLGDHPYGKQPVSYVEEKTYETVVGEPQPSYRSAPPSYKSPPPSYGSPEPSYKASEPSYDSHEPSYKASETSYKASETSYGSPEPSYKASETSYSTTLAPPYRRSPPEPSYGQNSYAPQQSYSLTSYKAVEPSLSTTVEPLYRRSPPEPSYGQDSYLAQQSYQARPTHVPNPQY